MQLLCGNHCFILKGYQKEWFSYYCSYFSTYEYNGSFYRMPTVSGLEKWYDKTPAYFKFSIKAPKTITHNKKMIDCQQEISDFYSVITNGLKDKLACVLWQFPPGFSYTDERLRLITQHLDNSFKNVIEFRNISWWQQHVFKELATKQLTFCNVSYPGLPTSMVYNTNIAYIRLHGIPKLFYSEYTYNEIEALYSELLKTTVIECYVYFNNTASLAGIINAMQLQKLQDKLHE